MEYDLRLTSENERAQGEDAKKFLDTVGKRAEELRALYPGISKQDYMRLAVTAYGILGAESKFYDSWRYWVKVRTPDLFIEAGKCIFRPPKCMMPLSQGPTQMKTIPEEVNRYQITEETLKSNPEHAAIATMAFLMKMKLYVDELAKKNQYRDSFIGMNDRNFPDYLVYFYQGKGAKFLQRPHDPNPRSNPYLGEVQDHMLGLLVTEYRCSPLDPPPSLGAEASAAK
jgi:hypothetical protein